jgi:hypothetical protein
MDESHRNQKWNDPQQFGTNPIHASDPNELNCDIRMKREFSLARLSTPPPTEVTIGRQPADILQTRDLTEQAP